MNGKRLIGFVLLAVGIALMVLANRSVDTSAEKVKHEVTGQYTQTTRWDFVGGMALLVLGSGLVLFSRKE